MKAAVIKNISIEGPGTLGAFLNKKGYELVTIDLEKGEKLPESAEGFAVALLMGGPMNVLEEEKYPYIAQELSFIEKCLSAGTAIVGICFGAQMIARALGAGVTANGRKEIGWYDIRLTGDGKEKSLFAGLPERQKVFHWHGDTFEIPKRAVRLAESELCRNQAFVYENGRERALALQYHVEIESGEEIAKWCELYEKEVEKELGPAGGNALLEETETEIDRLATITDRFYPNLLSWIEGR